ncbi:hypothetical protein FISHEDRAFT_70652 [Fistulina hepatica ATCC 64428]|uniref:F-box domain-containing protein n=1 Tax=Fistulina hepatica ATCC 64428 TaxID=1128425 RepID=A0A0D7AK70_9AGAR|nr:hypothetical protein FISHEDRAFT_70652 [Fistulina hepatica ATCC 64428]
MPLATMRHCHLCALPPELQRAVVAHLSPHDLRHLAHTSSKHTHLFCPANLAQVYIARFDIRPLYRRQPHAWPSDATIAAQLESVWRNVRPVLLADDIFSPDVDIMLAMAHLMLLEDDGNNRYQLERWGCYRFVRKYVIYHLDPPLAPGQDTRPWPVETPSLARALAIMWLLTTRRRLRTESLQDREQVFRLLLPIIVMPFRYRPTTLSPEYASIRNAALDHAFDLNSSNVLPSLFSPTSSKRLPVFHFSTGHLAQDFSLAPPPLVLSAIAHYFARYDELLDVSAFAPPHLPKNRREAIQSYRQAVAQAGAGADAVLPPQVGPTKEDFEEMWMFPSTVVPLVSCDGAFKSVPSVMSTVDKQDVSRLSARVGNVGALISLTPDWITSLYGGTLVTNRLPQPQGTDPREVGRERGESRRAGETEKWDGFSRAYDESYYRWTMSMTPAPLSLGTMTDNAISSTTTTSAVAATSTSTTTARPGEDNTDFRFARSEAARLACMFKPGSLNGLWSGQMAVADTEALQDVAMQAEMPVEWRPSFASRPLNIIFTERYAAMPAADGKTCPACADAVGSSMNPGAPRKCASGNRHYNGDGQSCCAHGLLPSGPLSSGWMPQETFAAVRRELDARATLRPSFEDVLTGRYVDTRRPVRQDGAALHVDGNDDDDGPHSYDPLYGESDGLTVPCGDHCYTYTRTLPPEPERSEECAGCALRERERREGWAGERVREGEPGRMGASGDTESLANRVFEEYGLGYACAACEDGIREMEEEQDVEMTDVDEDDDVDSEDDEDDDHDERMESDATFSPDDAMSVSSSHFGHSLCSVPSHRARPRPGACSHVQDVVLTGITEARHAAAWGDYAYIGRVRAADGLIGILRVPTARNALPHAMPIFLYGYLDGGGRNFIGHWRAAVPHDDEPFPLEGPFSMSRRID